MMYTCICLQISEGYFLRSLEYFRTIHANREALAGQAPAGTEPNLHGATFKYSGSGRDLYSIIKKRTGLQDHQDIFL